MLRDYQVDLYNDVKKSMINGHKHICVVCGCGSGKSYIIREIIDAAAKKYNQVLILVHRIELKDQLEELFCNCDFNYLQIELYQTATRHLDKIKNPSIIICDESHLSLNNSYYRVFDYFPNSYILGFTATPVKLGVGGLGIIYDDLIVGVSNKWLIEHKYLSPYEYYSFPLIERDNLVKKNGEYDEEQSTQLLDKPKIYGDVISQYHKFANGKKTIVFASSIDHSKKVCQVFNDNGIKAFHIDGNTPKKERKQAIRDFRDGKIKVLCNFLIVAEGLSVDDVECCILLKPTASLSRYLQSAMRCMRYKPNKVAIIIDHCQNYKEHGLVDDDRKWSLEKKKTRHHSDEKELTTRQCSHCFRVYSGRSTICPYCGYVNKKLKKEILIEQKAELERITEINRKKARMEVGMARDYQSLLKLAVERGYRNPSWWAKRIIEARHKKNYNI